VTIQQSGQNSH